jgi:hypothetical protein
MPTESCCATAFRAVAGEAEGARMFGVANDDKFFFWIFFFLRCRVSGMKSSSSSVSFCFGVTAVVALCEVDEANWRGGGADHVGVALGCVGRVVDDVASAATECDCSAPDNEIDEIVLVPPLGAKFNTLLVFACVNATLKAIVDGVGDANEATVMAQSTQYSEDFVVEQYFGEFLHRTHSALVDEAFIAGGQRRMVGGRPNNAKCRANE